MDTTFRSFLLKAALRAKNSGVFDVLVRYNPILRSRVERLISKEPNLEGELDLLSRRIIRAARKTPYGKNFPLPIAEWPILAKETFRKSPDDFSPPHLLPGIPAGTSGTSGTPLKLWRSLECVVAEQWFIDALLKPYGVDMRHSRLAILRADRLSGLKDDQGREIYGKTTHQGRRLTLSSSHLAPETIGWYVEALRAFDPEILWVYPSAAANLVELLRVSGSQLRVPVVLSSSEELPEALHQALEKQLSARVVNYYGQAERVCFAYSTTPGEYRFDPRYGKVELGEATIEPDGKTASAAIIGSGFWNRLTPLIRYDTGDRLYYPAEYGEKERSEIALGRRPFSGLAGRGDEYVLTRDGMRIIGLNHIPREVPHILQIQLVQTSFEDIEVRVAGTPEFSDAQRDRLVAQARAKLPESLKVVCLSDVPLEKTAQGKTPYVIRKVS